MEASIQAHLDHFARCMYGKQDLWFKSANRRQVAAILPSIIIITLRIYLSRENKRRDKLEADNVVANNGLVETTNADGTKDVRVVDTNQLDLTDRENLKL